MWVLTITLLWYGLMGMMMALKGGDHSIAQRLMGHLDRHVIQIERNGVK